MAALILIVSAMVVVFALGGLTAIAWVSWVLQVPAAPRQP